jgi:hypothetical protein
VIIDARGARWGFAFAACCGCAAVITCLLGIRRLRTPAHQPLRDLSCYIRAAMGWISSVVCLGVFGG